MLEIMLTFMLASLANTYTHTYTYIYLMCPRGFSVKYLNKNK